MLEVDMVARTGIHDPFSLSYVSHNIFDEKHYGGIIQRIKIGSLWFGEVLVIPHFHVPNKEAEETISLHIKPKDLL